MKNKARNGAIHGWLDLYSNVKSQWLQLHYQKRGYTAKENRPEEEENHILNPGYKYFLENCWSVAKKIENGINKSNGSVKYPDEENYIEIEDDDEEDDSVIPDPEYKFFLEHLKPDGKSYALEIVEANVYVKYESSIENENRVSNEAVVETEMHAPAKYNCKLHTHKSANGGCKHVASEAQNHADNHTGKQSVQELSSNKNLNGSASNNYAASKLQNRARSYSGKRRGRKPKGLSKPKATENPNGYSNLVVTEEHRRDRSGKQMDKCRGREQKGEQQSTDKNATVSNSSNQIGPGVQNRGLNYKGKRRGRKRKACSELHDTKKNGDNSNHVVSESHKHDRHRSNKVKKNFVPSVEDQKIGEGVKKESDDDVHQIRRLVHCPILNVRFLCEDNDEANARKRTQYREKLMEELKKPYCQEEYERLLKDITIRKHAQGQRVLRGLTKSYDEDRVSKSYLDCHIDLKRKMNANPDDYAKVLNLMRGFFYWLVNISHEGVFRPWRVQSYLDELLQH